MNSGKAVALSEACALARHDFLVFADARQTWSTKALKLLLENFTDPTIGAVSGDLIVSSGRGALEGVGLYWKYEKWIRKQESRFHSMVGVTGAICAVRRELFQPIPQGTILDDVYWPLQVAMQGYRVIHDERACAFDRLPEKTGDDKGKWKFEYIAFFRQPLDDLEMSLRFFDVTGGQRRFVAEASIVEGGWCG